MPRAPGRARLRAHAAGRVPDRSPGTTGTSGQPSAGAERVHRNSAFHRSPHHFGIQTLTPISSLSPANLHITAPLIPQGKPADALALHPRPCYRGRAASVRAPHPAAGTARALRALPGGGEAAPSPRAGRGRAAAPAQQESSAAPRDSAAGLRRGCAGGRWWQGGSAKL